MSDQIVIGSRRFTTTERVKIGLIVCRDISPFSLCHFSWINNDGLFCVKTTDTCLSLYLPGSDCEFSPLATTHFLVN